MFSLKSFDYVNFSVGQTGYTTVTGTHPDGSTVTASVTGTDAAQHFQFDGTWVNLNRVQFTSSGSRTFIDNIDLR